MPATYSGNGFTAVIADPRNITKDECVALARCGAAEWNAWRDQFKVRGRWPGPYKNCADFSGKDFSFESQDFTEFKFGDGADFSEAKFWNPFFVGAEFGHSCRFVGATFGDRSLFEGSKFGKEAIFSESTFGAEVSFAACQFDSGASFERCSFGASFNMRGAVFGDSASFDWARFAHRANIVGTLFVGDASFIATTIGFEADFAGVMTGGSLSFEAAIFEGQTGFQGLTWGALGHELNQNSFLKDLADERQASPWVFKAICFQGARFEGSVDFSDRHFEGITDFSKTSFPIAAPFMMEEQLSSRVAKELMRNKYGHLHLPQGRHVKFAMPPMFFQCKLHQNASFEGAVFPLAQGAEYAARAYRVLKQAFSAQQDTREEQRFFKLEMAEEAMAATGWKGWLYRAYESLSDFGFSVSRPLIKLVLLPALGALFLYLLCMAVAHPELWTSPLAAQPNLASQWLQFTLINLSPLPDSGALRDLRAALFGANGWGSLAAIVVEIIQKLLAFAGYFLSGLALRNLFKMK